MCSAKPSAIREGTPLFDTLSSMARRILGKDTRMRRQVMFNLEYSNVPARAGLTRSLSLIDIALWDIATEAFRSAAVSISRRLCEQRPM